MPKYRLLSLEELGSLHQEFIEFLVINGIVINGIVADDWEKMKFEESGKAEKVMELFSDTVLETVLRRIKFIEHRAKNRIHIFQCLAESQVLVGLEVPVSLDVDFTSPSTTISDLHKSLSGVRVFTVTKPYKKSREEELFDLLQLGGVITDNKLFNTLCLAL